VAELGKVYEKAGRVNDAIRATRMAINLAMEHNELREARNLRDTLSRYESEADQTPH
jgi:hypothetical protein